MHPFPPPQEHSNNEPDESDAGSLSPQTPDNAPRHHYDDRAFYPKRELPLINQESPLNVKLFNHHYQQMIDLMIHKFEELQMFSATKNFSVMHLDWAAGNPSDPLAAQTADKHETHAFAMGIKDQEIPAAFQKQFMISRSDKEVCLIVLAECSRSNRS